MNINLSREEKVILNLEHFITQTIIFHTPLSKGLPLIFFFTSVNLPALYPGIAPSYISSSFLAYL